MIEFCSNLEWEAVTAITTIIIAGITFWAARRVHEIANYTIKEKHLFEILEDYLAAHEAFKKEKFYGEDTSTKLIQAELKASIMKFCAVEKHIAAVLLEYSEGSRCSIVGASQPSREAKVFALFNDYSSFKKYVKVKL